MLKRRFRDHWVSLDLDLDLDLDLGSFRELNLLPTSVGQSVRNPNLSLKVICALDRDLGFFLFAGNGMSVNHPFDFPWKRGASFRRLGRHNCGPPLAQRKLLTTDFHRAKNSAGQPHSLNSST